MLTGPIVLILYEDPEDQIPKIVCRCDNYMAWIQEQRMPLHLHVEKGKEIRFNQVRIHTLQKQEVYAQLNAPEKCFKICYTFGI